MWRHSGRLTAEELRAILDLRAAPYAAALMAAELARQRSGVDPPAGTQAIRRRAEPVPLPRRRRQRGMFLVEAAAHLASVPAIDPRFAAAVAVAANRGIFYSRGGIPTSFASIIGRFEREYDQADRLVDEITHGGTTIEARGAAAIAKLEAEHREVVSAHATPAAMFLASIGKGVCRRRGRRRAAGGDRRAEPRGMAR